MLETLAVSVAVVEFTVTAARLGIGPLVADTGVASGSSVGALATSLSEGGGDDEEQSGDGSETHFEVEERWGLVSWTGPVRIISQLKDGKKIRTTGYAISCCVGHLVRAARGEVRLTWRSGSGRSDEEKKWLQSATPFIHIKVDGRICTSS